MLPIKRNQFLEGHVRWLKPFEP